MKIFTIDIEKGEKFYIAQCREHSNCFTQGKTIEETIHNIKEVLALILRVKRLKRMCKIPDSFVNKVK